MLVFQLPSGLDRLKLADETTIEGSCLTYRKGRHGDLWNWIPMDGYKAGKEQEGLFKYKESKLTSAR